MRVARRGAIARTRQAREQQGRRFRFEREIGQHVLHQRLIGQSFPNADRCAA
jgi:hypothetical protein